MNIINRFTAALQQYKSSFSALAGRWWRWGGCRVKRGSRGHRRPAAASFTVNSDGSRLVEEAEGECEAFALFVAEFFFLSLESDGKRGSATPRAMLLRRPWPRPLRAEADLDSGSTVGTLPLLPDRLSAGTFIQLCPLSA